MHPLSSVPKSSAPALDAERLSLVVQEPELCELLLEMRDWHLWRAASPWLAHERRHYHRLQAAAIKNRLTARQEAVEAYVMAKGRPFIWAEFCARFGRPL